jgi:hypothetical protein
LSQRQFAVLLGCSKSAVAKWEAGRAQPRLARLEQILAVSRMRLVARDHRGDPVRPFGEAAARDRGRRHYPAHIDIRQWRPGVYWWGDNDYGVHCLPPEFVWDDAPMPGGPPGTVELERGDDERFPAQRYRQDRASFGSFRAAWRTRPGFHPPRGFARGDALRGGYHPDVLGISAWFQERLDADGRAPADDRFDGEPP